MIREEYFCILFLNFLGLFMSFYTFQNFWNRGGSRKANLTRLWLAEAFVCEVVSWATSHGVGNVWVSENKTESEDITFLLLTSVSKKTDATKEGSCRAGFSVGNLLRQG